MPALRSVRRSRRLSHQPPSDELDWLRLESFDLAYLQYPDPEPPRSADTTTLLSSCSPNNQASSSSFVSTPETQSVAPQTPHKRKDGHIPRPPNAFMLYRSDFWAQQKETGCVERDHRHISRIAAHLWNNLTDRDRQPYRKRADQLKAEHVRRHPNYKYSPACRKDRLLKKKAKRDGVDEDERCKALAVLVMKGIRGTDLQRAVTKVDEKLERRALRKLAAKAWSDEQDDGEYKEGSSRTDLSKPNQHRRSRRPSKKSSLPDSQVKIEPSFTPKLVFSQPASPRSSPYIPTSEIPLLDLSASPAPSDIHEAQILAFKEEPSEDPLIDTQFQSYPTASKAENIKIEEAGRPFVDAHALSNLYETSGDRYMPIPYCPNDNTLDLYFNYDASAYFEGQDFSIFDDGPVMASPTAAVLSEEDEFAQWVNYDSIGKF